MRFWGRTNLNTQNSSVKVLKVVIFGAYALALYAEQEENGVAVLQEMLATVPIFNDLIRNVELALTKVDCRSPASTPAWSWTSRGLRGVAVGMPVKGEGEDFQNHNPRISGFHPSWLQLWPQHG
jgi:hypothetical protein